MVKVRPGACFEGIWGAEVLLPTFLSLALGGCEWSTSHCGHFSLGGKKNLLPMDKRLGGP